jgi:hypothetical protein
MVHISSHSIHLHIRNVGVVLARVPCAARPLGLRRGSSRRQHRVGGPCYHDHPTAGSCVHPGTHARTARRRLPFPSLPFLEFRLLLQF